MAVVVAPDSSLDRRELIANLLKNTSWKPRVEPDDLVTEGEAFIAPVIGEEGAADIERRTELFNVVAKDFSCSVGKVGFQHLFYDIS